MPALQAPGRKLFRSGLKRKNDPSSVLQPLLSVCGTRHNAGRDCQEILRNNRNRDSRETFRKIPLAFVILPRYYSFVGSHQRRIDQGDQMKNPNIMHWTKEGCIRWLNLHAPSFAWSDEDCAKQDVASPLTVDSARFEVFATMEAEDNGIFDPQYVNRWK